MINSPKHKFGKGQKLFEKADSYIADNKLDKATQKVEDALEIFTELDTHLMVATGQIKLGIIHELKGDWRKALEYYKEGVEIRREYAHIIKLSDAHRFVARAYYLLKQYEKAHQHAQLAFDILDEGDEPHPMLQAEALFILGSIYMKEKQFTSSVFYFKQALSMLTPQSNSRLSLGIKQNLGKVYQEIGRYEQSNMVLFEVLRTEQNFNNFPIVLGLLQDLAFNHVMLGNVAKATKYLTDAKEIHKTLLEAHAYIEDIWRYEYFNALIFYYLKRFEEADKYCEDAIIISEKDDNSLHLMKSLLLMAKILTATFNGSDDDLELIRNFLEETKGLAKKEGRDEILIDAYLQQVQLIKNTSHEREIPDILEKAEKIANQGKSDLHKGKIATQYGIFFHVQREYEKARESFQSAIDYYREAGHLDYLAEANYNISCTSCLLHLGEETLEHLHRAIDLNPKYKSVALNDEDFKSIKKDEAFLSLVED